jgi:Mg-chelatase subunit ChlD
MASKDEMEHARRWRLILGKDGEVSENLEASGQEGAAGEGVPADGDGSGLSEQDKRLDDALEALYGESQQGTLADSSPDIARWLGDIRTYFPAAAVQVMQRDAMSRLNVRRLLMQPEWLDELEPDAALAATLLSLRRMMPKRTQESARRVIGKVVDDLQKRLRFPLQQAVQGSLQRSARTRRPRHHEINWLATIRANLKHYQPKYQTVVPENLVGYGRKRSALRDVIVALDTSGSMAASVVYASIYAAVMASLPALAMKLVMFDTAVVDLTDELQDPVELLFGIQLGGGTNIERALAYCQQRIERPADTILVLISDLFEGGNVEEMMARMAKIQADGVQVVVLLALNDQGAPKFNREIAGQLADMGIPAFACTPDLFPELMAAVIERRDIGQWAAAHQIVTAPHN